MTAATMAEKIEQLVRNFAGPDYGPSTWAKQAELRKFAKAIQASLASRIETEGEEPVAGDVAETIQANPKSWAAWKREAEEHLATIEEMWVQFDRLRDATNRPKCGQAFMVGGHHIAPWGIVDHAISALDLSMMRADRIKHEQSECEKLRARLASPRPAVSEAMVEAGAKAIYLARFPDISPDKLASDFVWFHEGKGRSGSSVHYSTVAEAFRDARACLTAALSSVPGKG